MIVDKTGKTYLIHTKSGRQFPDSSAVDVMKTIGTSAGLKNQSLKDTELQF